MAHLLSNQATGRCRNRLGELAQARSALAAVLLADRPTLAAAAERVAAVIAAACPAADPEGDVCEVCKPRRLWQYPYRLDETLPGRLVRDALAAVELRHEGHLP